MMKKILVVGAGESGVGTALLAKEKGFAVLVSDSGFIKQNFKQELNDSCIPFVENNSDIELLINIDILVKSPGVPSKAPLIVAAKNRNIEVISEIEFASRFTNSFLICITGSNGKTTTTSLIYDILSKAGLNVCVAGNIGKSFARCLSEKDYDYFVLEISSFQLDDICEFHPNIGVITNITPDHLERYEYKMENYIAAKMRLCENMTSDDSLIYCIDDKISNNEVCNLKPEIQKIAFSIKENLSEGAWVEDNEIKINIKNKTMSMMIENLALQGKHNTYNSMAAAVVARVLEIRKETIKESLSDFQNIEHRLEFVTKVHGISFINDSKATNVNSTWYALESMNHPVIWIAGGTDKGNDYTELIPLVKEKVKALICLGVDNTKLLKTFSSIVPVVYEAESMKDAVDSAYYLGEQDDVVLLSPACASFDLFTDYEDRGRVFKTVIREL